MSITLSAETKQQVVIAALSAVGNGDPTSELSIDEQVRQRVVELAVEASSAGNEKSRLGRALSQLEGSTAFVAVIVGVKRDERNGRGIIGFKANNPGQGANEAGVETINTEPEYFEAGASMIARARALKGHRVVIYKEVESFDSNGTMKKSKVCRHLVDLGVPTDDENGKG